jgi:hypothetical protein
LQKDRENVITVKQFVSNFENSYGLKHRINFLVCQEDFSWYKNAKNRPGLLCIKPLADVKVSDQNQVGIPYNKTLFQ